MIEFLFLDLDDTILDFHKAERLALGKTFRSFGLEPTEDFKKYIEKEKKGEATMDDLKQYLDKKYKMKETANA